MGADVHEGVAVQRLTERQQLPPAHQRGLKAQQVVVATGGYHPRRHPLAERLPTDVLQLDARDYRNADALPEGPSGGRQRPVRQPIAEDLFLSGRTVH